MMKEAGRGELALCLSPENNGELRKGLTQGRGLIAFMFQLIHSGHTGDNGLEFGSFNYCFVLF